MMQKDKPKRCDLCSSDWSLTLWKEGEYKNFMNWVWAEGTSGYNSLKRERPVSINHKNKQVGKCLCSVKYII